MKQLNVFVFLFFVAVNTNAQTDNKETLIKEMLELSGASKMAFQTMEMMISSFKKQMPAVETDFWDEFMKEAQTGDLITMIAPVYAKHFTENEVKELIAFYKTPVGKKLVEKLPVISQESYGIGETWGKALSEKVAAKLKAAGYYQ
ncbi:DUF2059 domain-containing protein [Lacibacter sediminis]|uniref:DUF2059 domain-containing protein n=1 Tax=Lacibacter sediminis TaxID=2760713 RepID=A0A7G5XMA9_9BACT|nr:DUF2059 domain-containing protein [Lacibacter sediminis]QNA46612.1 DUF2059 domain-containing protein [Lacibacter sediminis]